MINRLDLEKDYSARKLLYERLRVNLDNSLKTRFSVEQMGYEIHTIQSRTKTFDSVLKKQNDEFKSNRNLKCLGDFDDICGLRIICFYQDQMNEITDILKSEYFCRQTKWLSDDEDRPSNLGDDDVNDYPFGYRARHFVFTVTNEWCQDPSWAGLIGLKAEIQLRTLPMHAWDEVSRQLIYKQPTDLPRESRMRMGVASAVFEFADKVFQEIKKIREHQIEAVNSAVASNNYESVEFNFDTFKFWIQKRFEDRQESSDAELDVYNRALEANVDFKILERAFHDAGVKDALKLQADSYELRASWVNAMLLLANDVYWEKYGRIWGEDVWKQYEEARNGLKDV